MRKRCVAVIGVVGLWWWRGDEPARHPHRPQAAVLVDAFAVLADRHVREYDRAGTKQHEMTLRITHGDLRFVGTRAGGAIGWQAGHKVKLAILESNGSTGEESTWGKHVKQLCDGAATNEYRFGVGWLENDGTVWFVHGPMDRLAPRFAPRAERMATEPLDAFALVTKASWCGIASAEQNVALFWREGGRILMNFCNRRQCTSLVVRVPIDTKDTLLGYGCVRDSCLFATRDKHGTTRLHRVTEKGRALVKVLEHTRPDSAVSIVGAGSRAFAIAYISTDGNMTVQRVGVDGSFSNVWHFDAEVVPSLAWANGKLFVAMPTRDAWVLDLPN